jgi:hypothetical protein
VSSGIKGLTYYNRIVVRNQTCLPWPKWICSDQFPPQVLRLLHRGVSDEASRSALKPLQACSAALEVRSDSKVAASRWTSIKLYNGTRGRFSPTLIVQEASRKFQRQVN